MNPLVPNDVIVIQVILVNEAPSPKSLQCILKVKSIYILVNGISSLI